MARRKDPGGVEEQGECTRESLGTWEIQLFPCLESRTRVTANIMNPGVDAELPAVDEPTRNTEKEASMVLQSERRAQFCEKSSWKS